MGGETMLEDPLSFEAFLELQEGDSTGRLILLTTINWINTNLRGMAFGLLLGAAFPGELRGGTPRPHGSDRGVRRV